MEPRRYRLKDAQAEHMGWSGRRRSKLLRPLFRKLPRWLRHLLGARGIQNARCFICGEKTLWGQIIDRRGILHRWCHMECGIYKYGVIQRKRKTIRNENGECVICGSMEPGDPIVCFNCGARAA